MAEGPATDIPIWPWICRVPIEPNPSMAAQWLRPCGAVPRDSVRPQKGCILVKALVVYDSVYGNTERVARAIADALAPAGEVKALRPDEVNLPELESLDFLVVGSPTQGWRPTPAVQKLLNTIPANALGSVKVTAFDTRMESRIAGLFGFAAGRIADGLSGKAGHLVASPEGFIVTGREGR